VLLCIGRVLRVRRLSMTKENNKELAAPGPARDQTVLGQTVDIRSVMLTGLFMLALFYTLYLASEFILPVILALLLDFLLRPAVRVLRKARIPEAVGAAVILLAFLSLLAFGFYQLSGPAGRWIAEAPKALRRIETEVKSWRGPVQQMSKAAEQVDRITTVTPEKRVETVELKQPSLIDSLVSGTRSAIAGVVVVMLLLYFLLASGDLFLTKLVRVLPTLTDKKTAVQAAYEMEDQVSVYLTTVTAINIGLGIAEASAMYLIGMPNPVLWGLMATVFNFVPYLGALVGATVIGTVGFVTFGEPQWAALAAGLYLLITSIEGGFVTPMLLARRLTLNPVVVLIGVIFWGWLWGIAGTLIAVPLMVTFKILCDHIKPLAPIGEFMGQ